MKLNKVMKGAAIGAVALMFSSCASDYLDTPVHGIIPAGDICKTSEAARQSVLGVCGRGMSYLWTSDYFNQGLQFLWQGETGMTCFYGEFLGSDNFQSIWAYPGTASLLNQEEGTLSMGQYTVCGTAWVYAYANIAPLNEIIAYIDAAEGDEDMKQFSKGQAYALRAHMYWHLLRVYGPRWEDSNNGEALCLVNRNSTSEANDKAPCTMNEILDQCYSDLDTSIEAFKAAGSFDRSLTYEPDLNIAYGIYARVAALKHDWAKVKEMAHNARQGYHVPTDESEFGGYLSFVDNDWMWSPSFNPVDNYIYGYWCAGFACNGYYAQNQNTNSRINITLYRKIPKTDSRRNWWLGEDNMPGKALAMFYNTKVVNPANLQFINDDIIRSAKTWMNSRKPAACTGGNPYKNTSVNVDNSKSLLTLGAQVKFWANGETGENGPCQVPYMRAVEMYLLEAEACAELGQTSEAQALLNEVNQPRDPKYTCTATGQALIDEVRLYTRIELWGEGFCWYNLKRWNMPCIREAWVKGNTKSGNIPVEYSDSVAPTQNVGWRYGIPPTERDYNTLLTEPIPGIHQGEN